MLYVLAAIGAVCVVVLLWRAFVSNPATPSERERRVTRPNRRPAPIAPDDDPEFLRGLGRKNPPEDDMKPPA